MRKKQDYISQQLKLPCLEIKMQMPISGGFLCLNFHVNIWFCFSFPHQGSEGSLSMVLLSNVPRGLLFKNLMGNYYKNFLWLWLWFLIWFCLCCFRENRSPVEGPECGNMDKKIVEVNGNAKRKQSDYEAQYPNKSPKNDHDDKHSSPSNSLGSFKKPSGDKLDWKVLRPSSVKQSRWWLYWLFDSVKIMPGLVLFQALGIYIGSRGFVRLFIHWYKDLHIFLLRFRI